MVGVLARLSPSVQREGASDVWGLSDGFARRVWVVWDAKGGPGCANTIVVFVLVDGGFVRCGAPDIASPGVDRVKKSVYDSDGHRGASERQGASGSGGAIHSALRTGTEVCARPRRRVRF